MARFYDTSCFNRRIYVCAFGPSENPLPCADAMIVEVSGDIEHGHASIRFGEPTEACLRKEISPEAFHTLFREAYKIIESGKLDLNNMCISCTGFQGVVIPTTLALKVHADLLKHGASL